MPRTNVHDWYVEVEHPDGNVLTPTIVGTPTRIPTVNNLPEIRIPVRRQDHWTASAFENQPMRVWYKGQQQPIEILKDVTHESGNSVLVGRGGLDLENRATEEYDSKPIHEIATELIQDYTGYAANVDEPLSDIEENVTLRETALSSEWEDNFPIDSNRPFRVNSDDLELARTAWMFDPDYISGEDFLPGAIGDTSETNADGDFRIGWYGGPLATTTQDESFFFTPDYDIPAGELSVAFRLWYSDDRDWYQNGPAFNITVWGGSGSEDLVNYGSEWGQNESTANWPWREGFNYSSEIPAGTSVEVEFDADESASTMSGTDTITADIGVWQQIENTNLENVTVTDSGGSTLTEGTDYDLKPVVGKIKFLSGGSVSDGESCDLDYDYQFDRAYFDAIAVYDDRFTYDFDDSDSDANGNIGGPQPFPASASIEGTQITPVRSITGARIEGTTPNSSGIDEVAASNDDGSTFPLTAASFPLEQDFTDVGGSFRSRLTLQRYGTTSTDNEYYVHQGYNRPVVNDVTEKADLDSAQTLVIDESFDNQVLNILQRLADRGDYVFEFQWNDDTGGISVAKSIEMAKFGTRADEDSLQLSDYSTTKSTQNVVQKATIKGSSQNIEGEEWTANLDTWVDLDHDFIVTNTDRVYDPSSDKVYSYSLDYDINFQLGQIKALSSGDMTDGTTYEINYDRKYHDTFAADGISNPREVVRELPVLVSDRACGQTAVTAVNKLKNPIESATLTFSADDIGFTMIDQLYVPGLPTEQQRFQVKDVQADSGTITVELGRPETLSDLLSDISSRVRAASSRL